MARDRVMNDVTPEPIPPAPSQAVDPRDHVSLAYAIACRLSPSDPKAALSYAYEAIVKAAEQFEPARGSFSTFAFLKAKGLRINQERYVSTKAAHCSYIVNYIRCASHRFESKDDLRAHLLKRYANTAAVYAAMDYADVRSVSIDAPIGFDVDDRSRHDVIVDTRADDPSEVAIRRADIAKVRAKVERLKRQERDVMRLAIEGCDDLAIGERIGLTHQRVAQIRASALEHLREMFARNRRA